MAHKPQLNKIGKPVQACDGHTLIVINVCLKIELSNILLSVVLGMSPQPVMSYSLLQKCTHYKSLRSICLEEHLFLSLE